MKIQGKLNFVLMTIMVELVKADVKSHKRKDCYH